ncbi:MAG: DUF1016 N-terminal domain-containing protein [Planctomycetota bacterium]
MTLPSVKCQDQHDSGLEEHGTNTPVSRPAVKKHHNKPAVARMNDTLLRDFRKIQELLNEANANDARARYEIAKRIEQIRTGDGGKYGKRAIVLLAKALGWSTSKVYSYAKVAETWPDLGAFSKSVCQRNKHGVMLSWSHLMVLATVADFDRRESLVKQVLEEGWSVQALKSNINPNPQYSQTVLAQIKPVDEGGTDNNPNQDVTPQAQMLRTLAVPVEALDVQVSTLQANMDAFGSHLSRMLSEADPTDLSTVLLDRLKQTRRKIEELCQVSMKRFDDLIARVETCCNSEAHPQNEWESISSATPGVLNSEDHKAPHDLNPVAVE